MTASVTDQETAAQGIGFPTLASTKLKECIKALEDMLPAPHGLTGAETRLVRSILIVVGGLNDITAIVDSIQCDILRLNLGIPNGAPNGLTVLK